MPTRDQDIASNTLQSRLQPMGESPRLDAASQQSSMPCRFDIDPGSEHHFFDARVIEYPARGARCRSRGRANFLPCSH